MKKKIIILLALIFSFTFRAKTLSAQEGVPLNANFMVGGTEVMVSTWASTEFKTTGPIPPVPINLDAHTPEVKMLELAESFFIALINGGRRSHEGRTTALIKFPDIKAKKLPLTVEEVGLAVLAAIARYDVQEIFSGKRVETVVITLGDTFDFGFPKGDQDLGKASNRIALSDANAVVNIISQTPPAGAMELLGLTNHPYANDWNRDAVRARLVDVIEGELDRLWVDSKSEGNLEGRGIKQLRETRLLAKVIADEIIMRAPRASVIFLEAITEPPHIERFARAGFEALFEINNRDRRSNTKWNWDDTNFSRLRETFTKATEAGFKYFSARLTEISGILQGTELSVHECMAINPRADELMARENVRFSRQDDRNAARSRRQAEILTDTRRMRMATKDAVAKAAKK